MSAPPREILDAILRMRPEQRVDAIAFLRKLVREGRPLAAITVLVDERGEPVALRVSDVG